MASGTYVLAVLGESPSVLTELLWWLLRIESQPIAGIEVWTTQSGATRLVEFVRGEPWRTFTDQVGLLPDLQSDQPEPEGGYGFRLHVFEDERGHPLGDVRSEAESAAVSATLHDRVRDLRAALSDQIPVVGSLAGGRKTVSAALQTAFSLQAGVRDRLVHVLLHAELEAHLRRSGQHGQFACPTPDWETRTGVPVREQVVVYDVPFPRLRYLVPRRLSSVLQDLPWADVWPALDANMGRNAAGFLKRVTYQRWTYTVTDRDTGRVLFDQKLTGREGALLAAMAQTPGDATAGQLVEWLDTHKVGWQPRKDRGSSDETRISAIRQAASHVRGKLEGIPVGLERFVPPEQGFDMHPIEVQWSLD